MPETATGKRRRVYVIGGSRGIGAAIVRALGAEGYDIVLTSRDAQGPARALCDELAARWPEQNFELHALDTGLRSGLDGMAERIRADEALYGLVYNAGQSYDALAATLDVDRAAALMQANFLGFAQLAGAAIRPMMRMRAGRIVAMGSVTALYGFVGNAAYAASKGAMLAYVRTLAVEVARKGLTVNYIAPGYVDTDLIAGYGEHLEPLIRQIPAGRIARPEEVAGMVSFVLSPEAGYVTGSILTVDGGLTASLVSRR